MPHIVDETQNEAALAIEAMREAALHARAVHARAELMRHMRVTAAKVSDRPLDAAVGFVAAEWMKAWGLDDDAHGDLALAIRHFTETFCRDAHTPSSATSKAIRSTTALLEAAFQRIGTTLFDQMAFRSECAHGWWEMIVPIPQHERKDRADVPRWKPGQAFWEVGAAAHCT